MTPAQQPGITADGIYTVTERMLQKIELQEGVLLDELRSRPALVSKFPYCAPCDELHPDCNKCIKEHDDAIRKAILDEMRSTLKYRGVLGLVDSLLSGIEK